jgi:hypothetical protein
MKGVLDVDKEDEVVAMIPGGGWVARMDVVENVSRPSVTTEIFQPVLGWIVRRGGDIDAVFMGSDGAYETSASLDSEQFTLIPPPIGASGA